MKQKIIYEFEFRGSEGGDYEDVIWDVTLYSLVDIY
jgi:hypothetical protein